MYAKLAAPLRRCVDGDSLSGKGMAPVDVLPMLAQAISCGADPEWKPCAGAPSFGELIECLADEGFVQAYGESLNVDGPCKEMLGRLRSGREAAKLGACVNVAPSGQTRRAVL